MPRSAVTRREALALIGASGAALLTGAVPARAARALAPPACVARPPPTEGPFFVDDALTDRVYASAPYAAGRRRFTRNSDDLLFRDGGSKLLLQLAPEPTGYAATFDIGLQIA